MKKNETLLLISNTRGVKIKGRAPHIDEVFSMLFTTLLTYMNGLVATAKEEDRGTLKDSLYDMFNQAATNVLDIFHPEQDMLHPDITTEAILRAENLIIQEKYSEMPKAEREAATAALQEWMRKFAERNKMAYPMIKEQKNDS